MAAYKTGTETVALGREMGGYEGEDIPRDAVNGNERVPPFANIHQRRRGIFVKSRDLVKGEATGGVSELFPRTKISATYVGEYAICFNSSLRAKTSCERDKPFPG